MTENNKYYTRFLDPSHSVISNMYWTEHFWTHCGICLRTGIAALSLWIFLFLLVFQNHFCMASLAIFLWIKVLCCCESWYLLLCKINCCFCLFLSMHKLYVHDKLKRNGRWNVQAGAAAKVSRHVIISLHLISGYLSQKYLHPFVIFYTKPEANACLGLPFKKHSYKNRYIPLFFLYRVKRRAFNH